MEKYKKSHAKILNILKNMERRLIILRIYMNKIENRITFKIKTGYILNF